MTYNKPDLKYTEMAQWIDEHAYSNKCDETTMYQYLYHLSNMLASKYGYFTTAEEYDQFSLFSASRLFLRLNNPKQFEYTDSGEPRMKQIKSILNYLKKVIYPYKVDFEIEFNLQSKDVEIIDIGSFDLGSHLVESSSLFDQLSYSFTTGDISKIVRSHLSKIPFRKRSPEWTNIYISCMLTLMDSITLTNTTLKNCNLDGKNKYSVLEKLYSDLRYNPPILFHLDESMSNYIRVLVNEIRHVLAAEISWKSNTYISAEASMKSLMCSALDLEED